MKKFLSMLVAVMLLAASMIMPAFAAGSTISVSSVSAKPGDTVTVNVSLSGNTGFKAYGMALTYDTSALELQSINAGALSGNGLFVGNTANGVATFAGMNAVTGDGVLFTATFKVKATTAGEYTVGINMDSIGMSSSDTMSVTTSAGKVSVSVPHTCSPEAVAEKKATCTTDGVKAHEKCACGKLYINGKEVTKADLVIPATGHTEKTVNVKEATCTTEGYTGDVVCSVCNATIKKGTTIAKLAHDWKWVIDKEATTEETGLKHEECSVCGEKRNENTVIDKVPEGHEHSYGDSWKSDASNHWHECECGDIADSAAHTFDWVVDKKATATEDGLKHQECTICGYAKAAVKISATGDALDEVPQTGDPVVVPAVTMAVIVTLCGMAVFFLTKKRQAAK